MKTIEGAMELYIMENPHVAEGTFEIEILVNKGYLKSKPECMKANAINSKYTITIAKNNYSPGVITSDVSCQVHGDLSKQEGEHKYKESDPPPPLMFRINNVIRERSEYIIAGIFILIFWVGWILGRGILSGQ
ncbi:MAG TPA: hypothetical protein PKK26_17970 [Candidatus Wallbacteria bacterium]|nr:hypothetical protein [Candidatus Wallbacteria bacterium]